MSPECPDPMEGLMKKKSIPRTPGQPGSIGNENKKSWNIRAFWENLPWEEVNYFHREIWTVWPAALGRAVIDNFVIPNGQVLALTSVVFRASVIVENNPVLGGDRYGFLADDYWGAGDDMVEWYVTTSAGLIMDRYGTGLTAAALVYQISGWTLLNTDIATPQVPFAVFVKERQNLQTYVQLVGDALSFPSDYLGVEYKGVWIPISTYNKLIREFNP